jgi:hypothetical protein
MEFLIVLAALTLVSLFVTRPLWPGSTVGSSGESEPRPASRADGDSDLEPTHDAVADLEVAREAKYREIRDAELDRRTGKLSEEDYEAIDSSLRAEAVEILNALDETHERLPSPD